MVTLLMLSNHEGLIPYLSHIPRHLEKNTKNTKTKQNNMGNKKEIRMNLFVNHLDILFSLLCR